MLTRKIMRASAVVSLVCAAMLTPAGPAFANRDEDGGGVTPSVSGSEGTGYEVQISVTSESAAPGGGDGDGGGSESWSTQATTSPGGRGHSGPGRMERDQAADPDSGDQPQGRLPGRDPGRDGHLSVGHRQYPNQRDR